MATILRRKPPQSGEPAARPVIPIVPVKPVVTAAKRKGTDAGKAALAKLIAERAENEYLDTITRYAEKVRNPKTAIRAKCVECSGGSLKEVAECRVKGCALHPFRMGINPFNKKTRERLEGQTSATDEEIDDDDDQAGEE